MRLTTNKNECNREMICRFEDCDICEEHCPHMNEDNCSCLQAVLEKLGEYEDAEDQGLLLRPKCRLGDVVYALWSIPTESKYVVYPAEVKEINLSSTNARKMIMYKLEPIAFRGRYNKYYDDDFGKLVFMSEEEAEQALAGKKEV